MYHMKCIAIDDEPFALELIAGYIQKTPFLEFAGAFTNPLKALSFLMNNKVDLIFLDINMPDLSGIQLLKSLSNSPHVVFITAYSEFGAESYDYNAVDYLLKPVKYERFLKAVNKVIDISGKENPKVETVRDHDNCILIKSGTQTLKVALDEILYIEGAGNYMTFFTLNKKIMSLFTMNEIMQILPSDLFVRIHKSYIVSIKHIEIIEKTHVIINKKPIPIGITYREHFTKYFRL
jgi:two-component system LytT family response regulator